MFRRSLLLAGLVGVTCCGVSGAVAPPTTSAPPAVLRRVVMKDAQTAEQFRKRLEELKKGGLFRRLLPGDLKQPKYAEISFLTGGNFLLVAGEREWVDAELPIIRQMGFLFERPRAHLQLSLRVVQLSGAANSDVIQMTETVRSLVANQRAEVLRAFSDLQAYLLERLKRRRGEDLRVYQEVRRLLPSLGSDERPQTVPEILLLLMLDRTLPESQEEVTSTDAGARTENALTELPRRLEAALSNPQLTDQAVTSDIQADLEEWKTTVAAARDWCSDYARALRQKEGATVGTLQAALEQPDCPLPSWIALRMRRSISLTDRLYPTLLQKHGVDALQELERRFQQALSRAEAVEKELVQQDAKAATGQKDSDGEARDEADKRSATEPLLRPGRIRRSLVELKLLAEQLVPTPLALFQSVVAASDEAAPERDQVIRMLREYTDERRKLDQRLAGLSVATVEPVNFPKLLTLEAGLNLWLRRASEAMSRALQHLFYNRYVEQLRLLANAQLGKSSSRDLLSGFSIDEVPDVARDLLLADTGVNIFVSNSVGLQFAPDTLNSVSAQVQARLPSKLGLTERVQQAGKAASALNLLTQQYGIQGESIVKALLAGGQAVPVRAGINLAAKASVGFDVSTVTLSLTANQTLQPESDKIADRVTNHSIDNATFTALSYEPMVLSTLTSNISYFENTGGVPILRKTPLVKDLLKDIPFAPFKQGKRKKGVYQSSVIILEPLVIPTIEDLVRFHTGWRSPEVVAGTTSATGRG